MKWNLLENLPDDTPDWHKVLLADEDGRVMGIASVFKRGEKLSISPMWMEQRMEQNAVQYAEVASAPDLTKKKKKTKEDEAPKKVVKDDFNDV